nr:unnamed protein product [Callosobruchus chinensis]
MIHCPGSQNVVADTLSRYVPVKNLHITPDRMSPRLMLTKLSDEYSKLRLNFDNMREDQMADKWITDKIKYLEDLQGSVAILSEKQARICEWFVMHRGILFKRGDISEGAKLCVPKAHIRELVMAHHRDFGHFGKTKVYLHMRERFFWPNMQKHIRQLVASCDICQKVMCAEKCHGPLNSVLPERPGDLVCTDLIGPLPPSRGGVAYVLVFVDAFTKYVRLYALKKATTRAILNRFIKDYCEKVQTPKCMLSDNGSQYTSKLWSQELDKLEIKYKRTLVYFPEGNLTERYNREVGRLLRTYCHEKHPRWAYVLDFVEFCLNNAVSESTGFAPVTLQLQQKQVNPIDEYLEYPEEFQNLGEIKDNREGVLMMVRDNLRAKAEKRAERFNTKFSPTVFYIGDKVLVRQHAQSSADDGQIKKLFALYNGPYYVVAQAGPNSYVLRDSEGVELPKQNVKNLRSYKDPPKVLD